ncbi:sensor histidine kinase [Phormidium tenue]|jgi:signal transduction histidine kinase|uniref:histidine kinase n=1 Tax=Phormidium tenue FACHB-1050 TaxID=2692857 RepID=A0ABR8CEX2_9CYAN|nr:sensor histidine kinase [Phormidium tenue]MBD2318242.1 sensor histidine kinase [Phormidium tenue FACHB-1050]
MNLLTLPSSSLQRTLRYAEWALLLMMLLLYAIDQYFYKIQLLPNLFFRAAIFIVIFFVLSFIFPLERPHWQRRVYVAIEIVLILVAQLLWIDFDILLYFFLIKSCFLLSRREVFFTVISTGVAYLFTVLWTLPLLGEQFAETIRPNHWEELYKPQIMVVSSLIEYVGISLFVILLGFVIVEERRSRQRAEALSLEIESLAAALERSRIARDIHDSLGHSLTTLNIQLELAQAMGQRNPDQANQALNNSRQLASQCLESVRQAVQAVREEFDLTTALQRLIDQVRQNHTFTIQVEVILPPLTLQTSHQLYCVVQEGFTNIQKHAHATKVHLSSQMTSEAILLELEDDGQGFDPTLTYNGYGLKGMQERVHLLGGELQIISAIGKGTRIRVMTPL